MAKGTNPETRRAQNSVSSNNAKNSTTREKKKPQAPQRLVGQKHPYRHDTDKWVRRARERALFVVKRSLIK